MRKGAAPVALVTGAARGLGACLARELSREGYDLILHHRRGRAQAARLAQAIRQEGGRAEIFAADLSRPSQVETLFRKIRLRFGKLDLLVNSAGTYRPTPLLRTRPEDWHSGLDSTATATFLSIRSALPLFPRTGGRIINLGDSACDKITARKMAPGYHVGKIGVLLLTRSFATQLIHRRITVNCISPGYLENSVDLPSPHNLPAGRAVRLAEVFHTVRYLLSPEADQVTGTNVIISGGWNL